MMSLYRLATCADLINHKCRYKKYWWNKKDIHLLTLKYPGVVFPEGQSWGLKQMGNLFCVNKIKQTKAIQILELGAGFNLFFDRRFGKDCEYWMADKSGFYEDDIFEVARKRRTNTNYIDTFLGEFSKDLPDNYFDLVFSVSVLEHVPLEDIDKVCDDMARIVRPGGFIAHSIDVTPGSTSKYGEKYYQCLKSSGFNLGPNHDIQWKVDTASKGQILLEPLSLVYTFHHGYKEDLWEFPRDVNFYSGTILVFAQKQSPSNYNQFESH
jgi:SAM-dependent methyltransferase